MPALNIYFYVNIAVCYQAKDGSAMRGVVVQLKQDFPFLGVPLIAHAQPA